MTFEGLGEMFGGDSEDMWKISAHADRGPSGGCSVCRPGSEDPHRRERKFILVIMTHYPGIYSIFL